MRRDEHAPLEATAEWSRLRLPGKGGDGLRALRGTEAAAQANDFHLVKATLQLVRQPGNTRDRAAQDEAVVLRSRADGGAQLLEAAGEGLLEQLVRGDLVSK